VDGDVLVEMEAEAEAVADEGEEGGEPSTVYARILLLDRPIQLRRHKKALDDRARRLMVVQL
jgi:hypothetical protein